MRTTRKIALLFLAAACGGGDGGTAPAVPVATVEVAPATATVPAGNTLQLTATLRDASGNVLTGRQIAWASNNTAAATVSQAGLVTGVAQGTATITATSEQKSGPANITVIVTAFRLVQAGRFHTCGVTQANSAYCWGRGDDGQLGNGQAGLGVQSNRPVAVSGGISFSAVSAGADHSCGITTGKGGSCWGNDGLGQLGNGPGGDATTPASVAGALSFALVSAGNEHTCGVSVTGTATTGPAHCWGDNFFGELGDGTALPEQQAPSLVTGGFTFIAVSAGTDHSCGISVTAPATTGPARCWGRGNSGQLGNGGVLNSNAPVLVSGGLTFLAVSAGGAHACGVAVTPPATNGPIHCWGANANGQLGNGTTANSSAPVLVAGPAGVNFTTVSAGESHTCALSTTGAAYCWGRGAEGQIGNSTSGVGLNFTTPQAVSLPVGVTAFASISAGSEHSCAVTGAGAAYCWGRGTFGRLGSGDLLDRTTPFRVQDPQ